MFSLFRRHKQEDTVTVVVTSDSKLVQLLHFLKDVTFVFSVYGLDGNKADVCYILEVPIEYINRAKAAGFFSSDLGGGTKSEDGVTRN